MRTQVVERRPELQLIQLGPWDDSTSKLLDPWRTGRCAARKEAHVTLEDNPRDLRFSCILDFEPICAYCEQSEREFVGAVDRKSGQMMYYGGSERSLKSIDATLLSRNSPISYGARSS
jgi:hypothetical protein